MSSVTPAFPEPSEHLALAQREVVDICRDLLRIDTSNFGDDSGPGERKAAEYVAALLEDVGLPATIVEGTPGRTNVITRITGVDPSRPALLLHGHLDVVPAQAADWQVDPFSGEIRDDFLWGRGAVDMKDMVAMVLALGRDLARSGRRPPRDLVLAFLADEEAGGNHGAGWLVQHRPELFEGVSEAVSEVGGFSIDLTTRQGDSQRAYLLQTAEKGIAWLRLVAHGRAGHGSVVNDDNAVTRLAAAVARIGTHRWPTVMTDAVEELLAGVSEIVGEPLPAEDFGALYRTIGSTAAFVGATLRNTSNPTGLQAGYKHNVIPGRASAMIDCRFVPGQEQALLDTVRELAGPDIDVEVVQQAVSLEVPFSGSLVEAMKGSLLAEDPGAAVLPYCLSGGTDNKAFAELGITGYGFAPLQLPSGIDFAGMFHGVDERVPLDGLRFGVRVLDRFVAAS